MQLIVIEMVAQFGDAVAQGGAPAVLAQHQVGLWDADILGRHDLVSRAFLEHAVLVDAGLVREGVLADHGLVALHGQAGDARHQPADRVQPFGVDAAWQVEVVAARPHRHHHFLERTVAGPLADAVDGALDLPRAFLDRGQRVGHRQSQVVVAVHAEHNLVDVAHILFEMANGGGILLGHRVADRVGDVDRRGAGGNGVLDYLSQKVQLRAGGVLG
jgi:hypothetical protein